MILKLLVSTIKEQTFTLTQLVLERYQGFQLLLENFKNSIHTSKLQKLKLKMNLRLQFRVGLFMLSVKQNCYSMVNTLIQNNQILYAVKFKVVILAPKLLDRGVTHLQTMEMLTLLLIMMVRQPKTLLFHLLKKEQQLWLLFMKINVILIKKVTMLYSVKQRV